MKRVLSWPMELYRNRKLIFKLAKNDFRTKYAGSYLGIIWAFIQPVITILVYWFVFSVGFRAGAGSLGIPFVLYLVAGIVPWFFFQDALNGGTNALIEYSYLVKKVVFNISILPIVKILSAMFVHLFFVVFTLILFACYKRMPDLYTLQLVYYTFCVFMFVLGLSYLTSAVVVFFRDLTHIIGILLQIGIWMTPIMWVPEDNLAAYPTVLKILKLNPIYYVVSGYRDSLIGKHLITDHPWWTLYFWGVTGLCIILGTTVFRRLKIHFADIL